MPVKPTRSNMRSKLRWGIVGIAALLLAAIAVDMPTNFNSAIDAINSKTALGLPHIPSKPFALGLDLQGGAHLIYKADISKISVGDREAAVEGVRDVIETRVNSLGVSESSIQTSKVGDEYRVLAELPGVKNVTEAIARIGDTPILEFKEENNVPPRELTADEKKQLEADNAKILATANEALKKITVERMDFALAVKQYSDDSTSKNNGGLIGYIGSNDVPSWYEWAKTAKLGDVSTNLISAPAGYAILKRGGEKDGETKIEASHILICYIGAQNCTEAKYTKTEAKAKAEELFKQANATNFADLAKQNSSDPGSKDAGGDLGKFSKGQMTKNFDDAVFKAKVGEIIGPVETEFGYHIIYKKGEEKEKLYELSAITFRTKTAQDIVPPIEPFKSTGLSGSNLKKAEVMTNSQTGDVEVSLTFDDTGKDLFAKITGRNIGKRVAIYLDQEIISSPTVQTQITEGKAVITGQFKIQDAKLLAQRLNAGALPVPVELVSQQTVGASLGEKSLEKSLYAGAVGILLVALFMILYYRLPGLLAATALTVYVALSLALFKLIGVTLSLAGIAGFVLSIGMAVDANVLIFERLKEELKNGRSLKSATEEGFLRAWPSIRDSNVSTMISCIFMIWFGSSFVRGFALTLTIGVLVHMFTAISVTRVLLRFIVPWFGEYGNWLFLGSQKQNKKV